MQGFAQYLPNLVGSFASSAESSPNEILPPGTIYDPTLLNEENHGSCPTRSDTSPSIESNSSTASPDNLLPISGNWTAKVEIPTLLIMGNPVGGYVEQTYTVGTNGLTVVDSDGNRFNGFTMLIDGSPVNIMSSSLIGNSTEAIQNFTLSTSLVPDAKISVIYSITYQFCQPSGLSINFLGNLGLPSTLTDQTFGIKFLGVPSNVASTTSWFTSNNGVVGTRIGFDWSDSIAHSPHFSSLTNSLTWNVNSNFTIDPVIVANTGVQQLGEYDHLLWYSQNLWWFFYSGEHTCTGSPCLYSLNYSTSPNGLQWTSQGAFATYSLSTGLIPQFDVAVSGDIITYAEDVQANNSFAWRQGILDPSGAIFWSGPQTFWSPTFAYPASAEFPSVTYDTQGRFWFVIPEQSGPLNGAESCPCYSDVYWLANGMMHESHLFTDSSSSSFTPSASQVLALSNGEAALVTCMLCFPYNDTTKSGASITAAFTNGEGSYWNNPVTLTTGGDDPLSFAAEALGSTVVVAFDDYATHQTVKTASLAYGSSTPSISTVESTTEPCLLGQIASCIGITMTKDGNGNLAVSVGDPNSTSNSVKVYKSTNSGMTWPLFETLTWQATFGYVNSITETPSVVGNGLTGLGWEQGSGSTKNIVFASFPIVVPNPSIYGNSWSRPGGSPYESYFSHIDDAISPGNGLLVLRQDDLDLPGRNGLDAMISRVFETPFAFGPGNYTVGYDNYTFANFGLGWQLNFPWMGNNYLHLPNGQAYVYQWNSSGVFENHAGTDFVMYHWTGTNNTYDLYMTDGTRYHFFSNQSLAYETDPTGNNTVTFYYSSGHISSIVDDVGRTISFSYNSNGQVSSISSGGIQYSYGYNSTTGNLISVTDPLGRVTHYAYKSGINSWLLTNVTYPTGGQTIFTYGKEAVGTEDWAYFVTLAAVYTSPNILDESNSYSYVASNGIISFTNETTADQSGKVQSYDIYQFPSGNNAYLVPITLTNSQTSAVASGTQVLLNVNWNNYGSRLASNLQNAEFTDSNGNPLYAWCESSCSSSLTTSNVWVKLDQSIPASQNIIIYLEINSLSANNFAGGFWGECPTCSPYYAQYDNGAKVFNFYDNFVGTSLSSSWTESGLTYLVNDGFSATGAPGSIPELITSSAQIGPGDAVDYNGTVYQSGSNWAEVGAISGSSNNYGSFIQSLSAATYGQQQSSLGKNKSSNLATTGVKGVWSVEITSSSASSYQLNYGHAYTVSSDAPSYPSYFGFKADQAASLTPSIVIQWIRSRLLPPNNVMPTVSFGAVGGPSTFNPTSPVYVPITISNWVGSSVSSGTQVLVNIDWQSFEPFVANNLQNVEFYDSSHNPVYAWCESGCSNTSTSSNVWMKLDQSIAAGQTVTYYLGIDSSSTNNLSPTGYWGLNPTATSIYAQYDNGAKVFNFYDNFAGTSLASGWTVEKGSPSANNGLTIPAGSLLTQTSSSFSIYGSTLDAYVSSVTYGTSGNHAGFGLLQDVNGGPYTAPSSPYWVNLGSSSGQSYNALFNQYSTSSDLQAVAESGAYYFNAGPGATITGGVWSLATTSQLGSFYVNYVVFSSSTVTVPPLVITIFHWEPLLPAPRPITNG
jgi:YD repeat-containing protein